MGKARDSYVATYRATALAYCLLLTAAGGPTQVRFEEDHEAVSPQVSKTPSWPRKFGQLQPFHGCTRTGMHGPTSIFWANLTPFSLQFGSIASPFRTGASAGAGSEGAAADGPDAVYIGRGTDGAITISDELGSSYQVLPPRRCGMQDGPACPVLKQLAPSDEIVQSLVGQMEAEWDGKSRMYTKLDRKDLADLEEVDSISIEFPRLART